jgi:hypothetical protein
MTTLRAIRSVGRPLAMLALVALLLAQVVAGVHAVKHLRAGDSTGMPGGTHVQFCLECLSFAPLTSAHGGGVTALAVAPAGLEAFVRPLDAGTVDSGSPLAYRSRAPPR